MRPLRMVPGRIRWLAMLCSNSSAKLSVMCSLYVALARVPRASGVNNQQRQSVLDRPRPKTSIPVDLQPPARYGEDAFDDRIDGHSRRVQEDCVGACDKRRGGARSIALITLRYLQRKGGKGSSNPLFFQLVMTPEGPLFKARGEKNLHLCPGEDHGAHVAPVRHQAGGDGERPLSLE